MRYSCQNHFKFHFRQYICCGTSEHENEDRKLLELQKLFRIIEILKVADLKHPQENRLSSILKFSATPFFNPCGEKDQFIVRNLCGQLNDHSTRGG